VIADCGLWIVDCGLRIAGLLNCWIAGLWDCGMKKSKIQNPKSAIPEWI